MKRGILVVLLSILIGLNSFGQFQNDFINVIEGKSIISESQVKSDIIQRKIALIKTSATLPNSTLLINNTHNQEFNNLDLSFQYLHIVNSSNLIFNNIIASNLRIESPLIQIEFSKNIIINNSLVDNLEIGTDNLFSSMFYSSYSTNVRFENSIIRNIHRAENETIDVSFVQFDNSSEIIINNNLFSDFYILAFNEGLFNSRFHLISMKNATNTIISNNEISNFNLVESEIYGEKDTVFIEIGGKNITISDNNIHSNYIGFRETTFIYIHHFSSHINIKDNMISDNIHASIIYIQSTLNAISITGNIIQDNRFISKIDIGNQIFIGGRGVKIIYLGGFVNESSEMSDRYAIVANNVIRNFGYMANYNQIELYSGAFFEYPSSYTYTVYNNTFDNIYPLDDMGYQDLGIKLMTIWNVVSPLVNTTILNNTFSNIAGVGTNNMEGIFVQFVKEFSGNKLINITNFSSSMGVIWRGIREISRHYAEISNNYLSLGSANYKTILRLYTFKGNESSELLLENNVFSFTDGKGRGIYYDFEHDNFIFRLQDNKFENMDDWLVGITGGKNIDFKCNKNTVNSVSAIGCFAIANPLGSQSGETLRYSALVLIVLAMYFIRRKRKKN